MLLWTKSDYLLCMESTSSGRRASCVEGGCLQPLRRIVDIHLVKLRLVIILCVVASGIGLGVGYLVGHASVDEGKAFELGRASGYVDGNSDGLSQGLENGVN